METSSLSDTTNNTKGNRISEELLVLHLLRENRTPERQIAETLGMSYTGVHYRVKRLKDIGVIQRIGVYVDPLIRVNKKWVFMGTCDNYSIRFTLQGGTTLCESEVEPSNPQWAIEIKKALPVGVTDLDFKVIETLRQNPEMTEVELAEKVGVRPRAAGRHLRFLMGRFVKTLPILNLNIMPFMYLLVTQDLEKSLSLLSKYSFMTLGDGKRGVIALFTREYNELEATAKNLGGNLLKVSSYVTP